MAPANTCNHSCKPFHLRDCALVSISTGLKAQTLTEFQDSLMRVDTASIYHHFWGRFLASRFSEPEYNNDFASWVYRALHEKALAEKLSMINPISYATIDNIREEVVDLVAEHLDLSDYPAWAKADQRFYFLRSQIVVFDTNCSLNQPEDLLAAIPTMSLGSVFYHFIDARRRTDEGYDDFSAWLMGWGEEYAELCLQLTGLDPFFSSLNELRWRVEQLLKNRLEGGAT
ncbi:MAG: hypothetical protein ACI8ZB_004133 [Desulforhopalus sp.]|jgi:hypothetical protein